MSSFSEERERERGRGCWYLSVLAVDAKCLSYLKFSPAGVHMLLQQQFLL